MEIIIFIALLVSLIKEIIAPYPRLDLSHYCSTSSKETTIQFDDENVYVAMLKLKRESYKPNLNCSLIVKAGPNYGLVAFIHKVKLRRYYSSEDVLKVIADNNRNTSLVWHGTNQEVSPKLSLFSSEDKGSIKISFASGNFKLMLSSKGLRIIFTIYQVTQNEQCNQNSSLLFNCGNNRCIHESLECDGYDNCGNNGDELNCSSSSETTIVVTFFSATLALMAFLIIAYLLRSKRNQHLESHYSKSYLTNGRNISATDCRFSIDYSDDDVHKASFYTSLPVLYPMRNVDQTNDAK